MTDSLTNEWGVREVLNSDHILDRSARAGVPRKEAKASSQKQRTPSLRPRNLSGRKGWGEDRYYQKKHLSEKISLTSGLENCEARSL